MKKIINIAAIMVLVSLMTQALAATKLAPVNNDVIFEVVLDSGMYVAPVITVFEKGYNRYDITNAGQKQINAKSKKDGSYLYELKDQTKPLYFSLELPDKLMNIILVNKFHFEPGDHIRIQVKRTLVPNIYDLEFSGQGSAKYRCRNEFKDATLISKIYKTPVKDKTGDKDINERLGNLDIVRNLIDKYEPEMSEYSFDLLNAEILGGYGVDMMFSINRKIDALIKAKDAAGLKRFADNYQRQFLTDFTTNIPGPVLHDAKNYSDFLMERLKTESLIKFNEVNYWYIFQRIVKIDSEPLRDKMIMNFMLRYWVRINNDYEGILTTAISTVKDPYYLSRIKEFQHNSAGGKAYDFSLQDVNGKIVRMHDLKGKVVFIDFWFTGCTFCKVYYSNVLTDVENLYENNPDMVFVTVCIDKKDQWLQSIKGGKYTSPKVINLYTNDEGQNNGIIKYYNISSYPRPMLIGKEGEIIKFSGNELRDKDSLIREIEMALKK